MNIPLGNYFSVSDVQRDYCKVFNKAKTTKLPVMILRDNKPYVVVIDATVWMGMESRLEELEKNLMMIKTVKKKEKDKKG